MSAINESPLKKRITKYWYLWLINWGYVGAVVSITFIHVTRGTLDVNILSIGTIIGGFLWFLFFAL